jgi:tetratricopeptide (TPR) repeat protein
MTSARLLLLALLVAAFSSPGAIAAPRDQQEIIELYQRGLAGDAGAVEQCIGKLEAVLQTQPANHLARVYLGSAYTLRSRDLGFGPRKLQALKQGLAAMDEAVAAAPNEPKIRLARALTTSALPRLFRRGTESRNDFSKLAEMAKSNPEKFEKSDLPLVFYHAGLAAKDAGNHAEAIELWQEASRFPGPPALTQKIQTALAEKW